MYYKDLLRHRQVWLGVALLWVILYHFPVNFDLLHLRGMGYGGVDICLFASGIGCFFSLSSKPDILGFMKRRLNRLLPTYWIFIIVWLVYQYTCGNFGWQMALGNLLAIQNFTGYDHAFNWYIGAIFLFYLLAPYFKAVAEQAKPLAKIAFLVFLLMISIPFWKTESDIITITRLPIFYIGMLFADLCKKNRKIRKIEIIGLAAASLLGLAALFLSFHFVPQRMWGYGLFWYPFILITPPLCLAISYIAGILEKRKLTKPIVAFASLCGDYSFELYLVHIPLLEILTACVYRFSHSNIRYLVWVIGIASIPVGCFVLRRLTMLWNRIQSKLQHA